MLLRNQINVRKKGFKRVLIYHSQLRGNQDPYQILFSAHLQCEGESSVVHSTNSYTSESLYGRRVLHWFEVENEEILGFIVSYNPGAHMKLLMVKNIAILTC